MKAKTLNPARAESEKKQARIKAADWAEQRARGVLRRTEIAVMLFVVIVTAGVAPMPSNGQQAPDQRQQKEGRERRESDKRGSTRDGGTHRGEWLRKHQNLPPQEQQKALERDPEFRKLPSERQDRLRERLRSFNNMPAEERERVIQRMEKWDRLTPEQKQRARNVFSQLRDMPEDRRRALYGAARNLNAMSPQQREQALNSPAMRSSFSDSERETLRNMLDLGLSAQTSR